MSRLPPLLPEEALNRVLRVARFDGYFVLTLAALFSVLSALGGDRAGAIIGLLIAGAGAIELHGAGLMEHGEPRGLNWVLGSQALLLLTVLAYCEFRLANVDLTLLRAAVTDDLKAQLTREGWTVDEFVQLAYRLTWYSVMVATALYQGGMFIYYLRRRRAVRQALEPVA